MSSTYDRHSPLGFFARVCWLDDATYELIQTVPPWLARWALTEGWIGCIREEMSLQPWLYLYAQAGHAYAARPGEAPHGLADDAPAFTARQTVG